MPQFPSRIPNKAFTQRRVDFDVEAFRRLIIQKGLDIVWEQTLPCPCYTPSSNFGMDLSQVNDIEEKHSGRSSCPTCEGKGFVRHSEQEIKCVFTEAISRFETGNQGTSHEGSAKFTLLPEHLPSYGDRFRLKESVIVYSEVIEYDGNPIQTLSRNIVTRPADLQGGPVNTDILAVYLTDANGNTIGEIDPAFYTKNGDQLEFTGINAGVDVPIVGGQYSVSYYSNPIYVVTGQPHTVRDTFIRNKTQEVHEQLPIQAFAKLVNK